MSTEVDVLLDEAEEMTRRAVAAIRVGARIEAKALNTAAERLIYRAAALDGEQP